MNVVFWAALGIGGSTLAGAGCGFWLGSMRQELSDAVTAFAAGVMLAAAAFGLFAPAMEIIDAAEMAAGWSALLLASGGLCGMLFLRVVAGISDSLGGGMLHGHPELMFVLAIALHKLPEGMAGGVGLNSMDPAAARMVVIGIALQNLPEGAVMIPPLLAAGVGRFRAGGIALATGLLNAAGVLVGALWSRLPGGMMPFALAFAGGAMLDVIVGQMIPQAAAGRSRGGTPIVLGGFLLMSCIGALF